MNEHESATASFFGASSRGTSAESASENEVLQDSHNVQLRIWVRPPWEGGWERTTLNTRAPSRPQLKRQDPRKWIFCPRILRTSSRLCPSRVFPAGRV